MALSALFLLKPFAAHRARAGAPPPPGPPGDAFAADIVASFMLQKTVSELSGSTSKLEFDIYGEIGIPNSTVAVNFLQPIGAPNWTNVIFSIVPYPKYSSISSMYLSILRASFMSLVVEQSTLHLTESLFGDTSLFEVLKFPGGITIIPPQAAFLLQKPYASFNFTLNFPIYKVQGRMNELKDQMKAGLQLDPYENLYIKLTNSEGSTVRPPTIVQASIVLEETWA
ncbi:Os05g0373500 [Oryza sativa Japonica Group]|uniref:Os05g0373500 protein n=1 Tax=Oryza sativa subsp. japonica TaxID=39947 RepID=Q0DIP1_ORYSJ|nr:Os05g0373500 [Oryza sativa Japonica Group]|eukprot:NP_001055368.2 Os05g0373500 [Oryza sativa Japonica Group]